MQTSAYNDEEDQVLARLVLKLSDSHLSKKLQLKANLTVEEGSRTVRLEEQVARSKAERDQLFWSSDVSEVKAQRRGQNFNRDTVENSTEVEAVVEEVLVKRTLK